MSFFISKRITKKLPFHHLAQPDSEHKASHFGDHGRRLLETLQIVFCENEKPLFPPGEDLLPLEPHDALQQGRPGLEGEVGVVGAAAVARQADTKKEGRTCQQFRGRALRERNKGIPGGLGIDGVPLPAVALECQRDKVEAGGILKDEEGRQ